MHELSIAQSLIAAAEAEVRRHGAVRVTRLTCRIGILRQADDWLMREAFDLARAGTLCEDCELVIEKTYMLARCPACQARYPVKNWEWRCPTCGADGQDPCGGDELELISIEAEVPDGDHRPQECLSEE